MTQDRLAYIILYVIVGLTLFITIADGIFNLNTSSVGLVKDVILIISSSWGTAIAAIYATKSRRGEEEKSDA